MNKELETSLQEKFMANLQWSMLFFVFEKACQDINEQSEDNSIIEKQFITEWKDSVHKNITKPDLEKINNILNSPKNMFNSALQSENESIESTEVYQEKYNKIISSIEDYFLKALNHNRER